MIKFFRKIRYNVMETGKTGKYLKYAIGEIILVVIGILIALQINNANEARKERAREVNYLKNLKSDLISEIDNNSAFATYRYEKAKACTVLLSAKEPTTIEDVEEYTDRYEQVFIWSVFVPNNNTFKELLSSGNLSLIKNDSIKNALLELDKHYAALATGEEHMRREHQDYLYDQNIENIEALGFFDMTTPAYGFPERLTAADIPESKHQKLIEDAQWQHNDEMFKNGLRLAMMNNSFLAGIHKDMVDNINQLIQMINNDISN
ncbi:DUF6090 family protein [Winogradskyella ouciana]|uniref:Uncharacterized protein n=1 Tax=Winogradskyella ouciana TaxID=2608631 RepID=A0A7K1GEY7_9FLAO|nr:DUF6090 family protein [Winogradskyella ouciana]MTE27846.1 hypothetical protein [Winogradskyella ouciana]